MQLLKIWINSGLHRTASKRTFEAGIHGPSWSEIFLIFFGLDRPVRPVVSWRCYWPEMVYFFCGPGPINSGPWIPGSRTSLIRDIIYKIFFDRRPTNMLHIICQKRWLWFRIMLLLESGIHGPKLIGPGPPKKENLDPFGPRTAQRNFGPVQTKKKN